MRRVLWLLGFIGLGVLIGFMVRLVMPRRDEPAVYTTTWPDEVSEARRSA